MKDSYIDSSDRDGWAEWVVEGVRCCMCQDNLHVSQQQQQQDQLEDRTKINQPHSVHTEHCKQLNSEQQTRRESHSTGTFNLQLAHVACPPAPNMGCD